MPILRSLSTPFPQRRPPYLLSDNKYMSSITSPSRDNAPADALYTAVTKQKEDPELLTLNAKLRGQKQRLLHWAYNWCGYCNNADEFKGGDLSAVASSVMIAIEKLLNDAEQVQQSELAVPLAPVLTSPTKPDMEKEKVKTSWTEPEITRINEIVMELTKHIDILYSISSFRNSASDHSPMLPVSPDRSNMSSFPLFSKASVQARAGDVKSPRIEKTDSSFDFRSYKPHETIHKKTLDSIFQERDLFIADSSSLQSPKAPSPRGSSPPPYEPVAHQSSKFIRLLSANSLPEISRPTNLASNLPVLVEPANVPGPRLRRERPTHLVRAWNNLIDNAKVSHLGLLRFLGYCVDSTNSTHALVHLLPSHPPQSRSLGPRSLVSLFPSPAARQDSAIPNLEDRFHLSYSLSLAVLHLRSQNILHGDLSSYGVLIFPNTESVTTHDTVSLSRYDLSRPYLTAFSHPYEQNKESRHLSICRYWDESQSIDERGSWVYDLYNLGLILLEIGLWTPLSTLYKDKYDKETFKARVETSYVTKLGAKCGSAYMKVVQLCLDAPKYMASSNPMADFRRAVPHPQTHAYTYPGCQETADDFSKHFTLAITHILHHCVSLDIFSPLPDVDLVESLPPSLPAQSVGQETPENAPTHEQEEKTEEAENPQSSNRTRTIRKWSNVEIPDEDIATWNKTATKLSKLLAKVVKDPSESCSVSLMMAGDSAESAKPTICITCSSVRRVRAALKKYFKCQPGWDLVVFRGGVQQSTVCRARRRGKKYRPAAVGNVPENMETDPCYQKIPGCGASIGAYRDDQHLPPVSFGGTILVDGVPYGMTVHHMLDASADSDDEDESSADSDNDDNDDQPRKSSMNHWVPSAELMGYNNSYTIELSDEEDDDDLDDEDFCLSDDLSNDDDSSDEDDDDDEEDGDDDDDASSVGDASAFDPDHDSRITVTQPALDDVREKFFPSLEDRDDEHIASHSLGHLHASSGLRRWTRQGTKHEIDWALIKVDSRRCQQQMNTVNALDAQIMANASTPSPPQNTGNLAVYKLNKVAEAKEIGGLPVHCRGRTSGFQSGRISKAMSLLKMQGRASFSSSFSVDGNFGIPGDSGAWVFDQITGQVCGHVLAWSEKSRTAYIAPMQVLFEDIARTLGAELVALPGSPEARKWTVMMAPKHKTTSASLPASSASASATASRRRKHRTPSAAGLAANVGNAQDKLLGRKYPHGLPVDMHNKTAAAAAAGATDDPASPRLTRDYNNNSSNNNNNNNSNNSKSDRLKGVAATSYHNVNSLIARQRTMMGRLPA